MPNPFKYQEVVEMQTSNSDCNLSADMESRGRYMVGASFPTKVVDMHVKKILRWSFNDVIHACANLGNYILAEQLISQVITTLSLVKSDFPMEIYLDGMITITELVNS